MFLFFCTWGSSVLSTLPSKGRSPPCGPFFSHVGQVPFFLFKYRLFWFAQSVWFSSFGGSFLGGASSLSVTNSFVPPFPLWGRPPPLWSSWRKSFPMVKNIVPPLCLLVFGRSFCFLGRGLFHRTLPPGRLLPCPRRKFSTSPPYSLRPLLGASLLAVPFYLFVSTRGPGDEKAKFLTLSMWSLCLLLFATKSSPFFFS